MNMYIFKHDHRTGLCAWSSLNSSRLQ